MVEKNYNTRLFEKNIRQVLGKTDVNDEIERTILENSDLFWYFNNGITIIADKIDKSLVGGGNRDYGSFKLNNIAIVNGAQTVSSIGRFGTTNLNHPNLDNVRVSLRMVQLSDTPGKILIKTLQNIITVKIVLRIEISSHRILKQMRIKTELLIDGIDYNVMRSENFSKIQKNLLI